MNDITESSLGDGWAEFASSSLSEYSRSRNLTQEPRARSRSRGRGRTVFPDLVLGSSSVTVLVQPRLSCPGMTQPMVDFPHCQSLRKFPTGQFDGGNSSAEVPSSQVSQVDNQDQSPQGEWTEEISERETRMANKYLKKYPPPLAIGATPGESSLDSISPPVHVPIMEIKSKWW